MQWIHIVQEELYFSQLLHIELLLALAGMLQQKYYLLNLVHNPSKMANGKLTWRFFNRSCLFCFWLFCFRLFLVLASIDQIATTNLKSKCGKCGKTTFLYWDLLILLKWPRILKSFVNLDTSSFPDLKINILIICLSFKSSLGKQ